MSLGLMNKKAKIVEYTRSTDSMGFSIETEALIANIRTYVEGRHGSERWSNLASFSEATELFRFRRIPNVEVTTKMYIIYDSAKYDILSVENIRGKGMYIEVLAKRSLPSNG